MEPHAHNWIDGAPAEAESGAWFEVASAADRAGLGRWPRSNAADLDEALHAARLAEPAWRALGAGWRTEMLAEAAKRLISEPDPGAVSQRALGLTPHEFARHLAGLDAAVSDGLTPGALNGALARGPLGARDGPCVLAPSWGSGWHAPARAAFFALRAGRPLIFAPDGALPAIGDALRDALAYLPRGVFQVLHDDTRTLLRAAWERRDLPTAIVAAARVDAVTPIPAHVELVRARRTTAVVDPTTDLERRVETILDAFVGRARALSGSRSGQVGRVVVPVRAFSRVSELVLDRLSSSADAACPIPLALRTQADALETAAALGLDEGATAIVSGVEADSPDFPVVLTNVEPAMRVARHATPCGLLLLLRAPDVRSAHALAMRLDMEVRS